MSVKHFIRVVGVTAAVVVAGWTNALVFTAAAQGREEEKNPETAYAETDSSWRDAYESTDEQGK